MADVFDAIKSPQKRRPDVFDRISLPKRSEGDVFDAIAPAQAATGEAIAPSDIETPSLTPKVSVSVKYGDVLPDTDRPRGLLDDVVQKGAVLATAINRGLASIPGGLVDLASIPQNVLADLAGIEGLRTERPFLGTEQLESLIPGRTEPQTPTENVIAAAGEALGANLLPEAGILGLAPRLRSLIPAARGGVAREVVRQATEEIVKRPRLAAATGAGASAGAAAGAGTAEAVAPGSDLARVAGELAGGISGGVAPAIGAARRGAARAVREAVDIPETKPDVFDITDTDQGILGKSGEIQGSTGSETVVKTVNRDIPAKYKVVELDELQPSHDPDTFAENPRYPRGVQERDYLRDKDAQAAVIRNAQSFDPRFVINDTPTPVDGPPQVTPAGIVLGGNSRVMSMARVYRSGQGDVIKSDLLENASRFGLDPEQVADMKNPVLVRELAESPKTTLEAAALGSDLNRGFTRSLNEFGQAVSAGKRVTPETLGARISRLAPLRGEPPGPPPKAPTPPSAGAPPAGEPPGILEKVDRIVKPAPKTLGEKVLERIPKLKDVKRLFQTTFTSEFTPLREAERQIFIARGQERPVLDLARKFEQIGGSPGKGQADVLEFRAAVMQPLRRIQKEIPGVDIDNNFKRYVFLRRVGTRLKEDPELKRVGDFTLESVSTGLDEMRREIGDAFDRIASIADGPYQEKMDAALRLQVESGRISQELYDKIRESNDFYAPFKLMKYLEEGEATMGAGRNIEDLSALTRAITGIDSTEFSLADFLAESEKQIYRSRLLAEKNKKMLELDKLAGKDPTGEIFKKERPTRYYRVHYKPAEQILDQLYMQLTSNNPQLLEQSFVKVGRAVELADKVGLRLAFRNLPFGVLGRATIGGIDLKGNVSLRAFTSETIAHELAHSFDVPLRDAEGSIVTEVKKVFGKERVIIKRVSSAINDRKLAEAISGKKLKFGEADSFQQELKQLVNYTGLGGSERYRNSAVERFAEFIHLYVHNPRQARQLAPTWTDYFEKSILPKQRIKELVEHLGQFFQEVDKLPNILKPLKEMDNKNYLELAIRRAFPEEKPIVAVAPGAVPRRSTEPGRRPEKGFEIVNYYKNGTMQALRVNQEVADAIHGLTAPGASIAAKTAGLFGNLLRGGATFYNVPFAFWNLFAADLPRVALESRFGIQRWEDIYKFPADFIYAAYTSIKGNFGKPNDLYLAFLRSGAANSTIQKALTPDLIKNPPGVPRKAGRHIKNALSSVASFSSAAEETSKLIGFRRGIRLKGIETLPKQKQLQMLEEIVTEVRNFAGSPDFLRRGRAASGAKLENLNLIFMFYNARIQGVSSTFARLITGTGAARGKAAASLALRTAGKITGAVGIPALTLHLVNTSDDEIELDGPRGKIRMTRREAYNLVPEWERTNYFMIPTSRYFVNDRGQIVPDFYKWQKRELIKLYANLVEASVNVARDRDPEALKAFAVEFLESTSPVNIEGDGALERLESVISSTNPLMKGTVELALGRDTFRHRDTVPKFIEGEPSEQISPEEQFTESTPEFAKAIGKATGTSPLRIEQAARSFTAGGLAQFSPRQPGARGKAFGAPIVGPILQRLVKSDFIRGDEEEIEALEKALLEQGDGKANLVRQAEVINAQLKRLEPEERFKRLQEIKRENQNLSTKVLDIIEQEKRGLAPEERLLRQLQVENGARARYIVGKLKSMSHAEQLQFRRRLRETRILSDRVAQQVNLLMKDKAQ